MQVETKGIESNMPQCAKCGKVVRYRIISYEIWKDRDYSPEFYDKPLCKSCYNKLCDVWNEYTKETTAEALCKHLGGMGLNATVESKVYPFPLGGGIIGSVRVANRNIDLVEMEWAKKAFGEYGEGTIDVYRCNFVVQAKVDGLEDKLRAYTEPVTSFFRVVDFEWKGKELAQVLNNDTDIRKTWYMLIVKHRGHSKDRPAVEIEPNRKDQCIRISPRFYPTVVSAFPTPEAFEVFDRIAQHICSIINRPS